MGFLFIRPASKRIDRLFPYVMDPEKTTLPEDENRRLVSGIHLDPENAYCNILAVQRKFRKEQGIHLCHAYQTFSPDEATAEQAHTIGVRTAERLWGDRFQVLVCTHRNDPAHIHNHFLINTVSYVDGKKFPQKETYFYRMMEASAQVCREFGVPAETDPGFDYSESYSARLAEKNGKPTFTTLLKQDVDMAVSMSLSEREFFRNLEDMGYEINRKEPERPSLKEYGGKYYRYFDRIGMNYRMEVIRERILKNTRREDPFPEEIREEVRRYRRDHPLPEGLSGIAGLYAAYCRELHILLRYPHSLKKVTHFLREDLIKLDRLDEETRFLAENSIQTACDLAACRNALELEIEKKTEERKGPRNALRRARTRGDEAAASELRRSIASMAVTLRKLRKESAICTHIGERMEKMQAELKAIQKQTEEKERENHEQFFGRSSRTGHENEPERR